MPSKAPEARRFLPGGDEEHGLLPWLYLRPLSDKKKTERNRVVRLSRHCLEYCSRYCCATSSTTQRKACIARIACRDGSEVSWCFLQKLAKMNREIQKHTQHFETTYHLIRWKNYLLLISHRERTSSTKGLFGFVQNRSSADRRDDRISSFISADVRHVRENYLEDEFLF